MLTHHALEMLKCRTGLTKVQCVKVIGLRYHAIGRVVPKNSAWLIAARTVAS